MSTWPAARQSTDTTHAPQCSRCPFSPCLCVVVVVVVSAAWRRVAAAGHFLAFMALTTVARSVPIKSACSPFATACSVRYYRRHLARPVTLRLAAKDRRFLRGRLNSFVSRRCRARRQGGQPNGHGVVLRRRSCACHVRACPAVKGPGLRCGCLETLMVRNRVLRNPCAPRRLVGVSESAPPEAGRSAPGE